MAAQDTHDGEVSVVDRLHSWCDNLLALCHEAEGEADLQGTIAECMEEVRGWYARDPEALKKAVNCSDDQHVSPVHKAVMMNDPLATVLKFFLADLQADADVKDDRKNTPLMVAAFFDHGAASAAVLVEHGADITLAGAYRSTALMNAAETLNRDMIALLLERAGTNAQSMKEAESNKGKTAMLLAMANDDEEIPPHIKLKCLELLDPETTPQVAEVCQLVDEAMS